MAYDRYDTRGEPRDERSRWRDERHSGREWQEDRGRRDERGFFERAGDEIASWFGDDDRGQDGRDMREGRSGGRPPDQDRGRERDWNENRGPFARGGSSDRDYNPGYRREASGNRDWDREPGRDRGPERARDYRPMAGDYGRSEQFFAASGVGRGERGLGGYDQSQTPWGRDDYRRTSSAGTSDNARSFDPHYHSWRERHLSDLDRDYEDYRRENQSRFESEFATWRERRQQKRGLLGQIRENMEIVGSDEQPVGTVERVAGDRIILRRTDAEDGSLHSLSCSDIERVEGDRVFLDYAASGVQDRWRDESRSRALFEREDQGEMGPGVLDRSFGGTYR